MTAKIEDEAQINPQRLSELISAIKEYDLDGVEDILSASPSLVNAGDESGRTPLHYACMNDYWGFNAVEVAEAILSYKVNLNVRDALGRTPLWYACCYIRGDEDDSDETTDANCLEKVSPIICMLIERKVRVDVGDKDGVTPLHMAAAHWDEPLVRVLLSRGAPVNARIKDNQHLYNGRLILLDNHTGVQATIGATPLHLNPSPHIVKLLVMNGADVNALDEYGKAPKDYMK
jgi:ankyrin repeat protein